MRPAPSPCERAWRAHNRWLGSFAVGSIIAGAFVYAGGRGVDGPDPFYSALAIEFAAWGTINLTFGALGERDRRRTRREGDEEGAFAAKAAAIGRLLVFNRWLNALWLSTGIALLAGGYVVWSAALCGHGVGVLVQAIALAVADERFLARLRRCASVAAGPLTGAARRAGTGRSAP